MATNMKFKMVRKGKYEAENGLTIQRHYYNGEKAWYVIDGTEILCKRMSLESAKRWVDQYY